MLALFNDLLTKTGLPETVVQSISIGSFIIIAFFISWIFYLITKSILFKSISAVFKKSNFKWYNERHFNPLFSKLAYMAPAIVLYFFAASFPDLKDFLQRLIFAYMVIVGLTMLNPLSDAIEAVYNQTFKLAKQRPITGYLEIIQIFLVVIGFILVISILINRSPGQLLAGIGALTAVILLIFKDTILGFVSAIKVASADMVRIGDWIEMPKYGADGDVMEINLTAIKVQNWDKTISMIPTYALTSDSFKNWRGMEESGGRRIKRAIYIDMTSVKFCDESMLSKFEKIHLLKDYIRSKKEEVTAYNKEHDIDTSVDINGRRITNLGTFRAYLEGYLHAHPKIHDNMTFLVRHLAPGNNGLPVEIYVFSNDQEWANFEAIQSDIFDHIIAALSIFDLRIFQNPTGTDFQHFTH